jgi:hypothetical protein
MGAGRCRARTQWGISYALSPLKSVSLRHNRRSQGAHFLRYSYSFAPISYAALSHDGKKVVSTACPQFGIMQM